MSTVPPEVRHNHHLFPAFCSHEDQWGEDGWLYSPLDGHFYHYNLDRKEQAEYIGAGLDRPALVARATEDKDTPLLAWLEDLTTLRTPEAEYVCFRRSGLLRRFSRVLTPDAHGIPRMAAPEVLDAATQTGALGAWLAAQRG